MENLRLLLLSVLSGSDKLEIALKLKISVSKLNSYISGMGVKKEEMEKILSASFEYFCDKYRKLISDLEAANGITEIQNSNTQN